MTKHNRALPFGRGTVVLGLALLAASVLLLALRGAVLAGVALAVIGVLFAIFASRGASRGGMLKERQAKGPFSKVETECLDVKVDASTNIMRGVVRKGLFEGQQISAMHPAELALVWQDCRGDDPRSASLIGAHLDAISPRWREDVARGEERMASGPDGRISAAEAYKILGLSAGASRDQIRHAHRDLMLKLHPDRGGSTYLSSKVNEAKDVLLALNNR